MNLNEIEAGCSCIIRQMDVQDLMAGRLQSLGMIPGTTVTVLHRKGNGTLVLNLRGTRFALGGALTARIGVEPCPEN